MSALPSRNIEKATSFFRLSARGNNADVLQVIQEVPHDDAMAAVGKLEAYAPPQADIDNANLHMSAAKRVFDRDLVDPQAAYDDDSSLVAPISASSWRVSPDEFIIKIDASPLHMSAAKRLFDPKKEMEKEVADKDDEALPPEESVKHENEFKQFWNKLLQAYSGSGSK